MDDGTKVMSGEKFLENEMKFERFLPNSYKSKIIKETLLKEALLTNIINAK